MLLELAESSSVTVATKLFVEAGLASHLTGSEPLTMLAPLDEAFRGECKCRPDPPVRVGGALSQVWACVSTGSGVMTPELRKLLRNHLVKGRLSSSALYHGQELETLAGLKLRVFVYRNVRQPRRFCSGSCCL